MLTLNYTLTSLSSIFFPLSLPFPWWLLLLVFPHHAGSSTGEVSLWLANPAASAADAALTRLGTALLPDQQATLVLDLLVLSAAAAAPGGSNGSNVGWQLLLAAGKTMGKVAVWCSGVLSPGAGTAGAEAGAEAAVTPAGITRQQLAIAVAAGSGSSRQCHGRTGFVTGVCWSPWEELLCSSGADGQVKSWKWGPRGLQVRGAICYMGPVNPGLHLACYVIDSVRPTCTARPQQ